jgi:hypothetical protein
MYVIDGIDGIMAKNDRLPFHYDVIDGIIVKLTCSPSPFYFWHVMSLMVVRQL